LSKDDVYPDDRDGPVIRPPILDTVGQCFFTFSHRRAGSWLGISQVLSPVFPLISRSPPAAVRI